MVATESHRKSVLQGLREHGVDIATVSGQGRYIPLDATEALSTFMESAGPDRERFLSTFGALIRHAGAAGGENKRVVVFGEMVAVLCAKDRMKDAIELEQLWNELAQTHSFYLRCAYPMTEELRGEPYTTICAEHSAVVQVEARFLRPRRRSTFTRSQSRNRSLGREECRREPWYPCWAGIRLKTFPSRVSVVPPC